MRRNLPRPRGAWLFSAAAGIGLCASTSARAADPSRAQALFDEGLQLRDRGLAAEACVRFRQSMEAEPSAGALLNVAGCSTQEGKLAQSLEEYRALLVLNEATLDAERRKNIDARARESMRSLQARVPSVELRITPNPEVMSVELDGKPFERTRLGSAQPADPGAHRLRVTAQGFKPTEVPFSLAESEKRVLEIELVAIPRDGTSAGAQDGGADPRLVSGWVVGGVGVVGLGLGGAFLGLAGDRASKIEDLCGAGARPPVCEQTERAQDANDLSDEGSAFELGGWIGIGIGGAALATGVGLLVATLVDPQAAGRASRTAIVSVAPCGPDGPGLTVLGDF